MRFGSTSRLTALAAGSLAILAVAAPGAANANPWDANHDVACERGATTINELGSSLQRDAQWAWGATILTAPAAVSNPAFPGSYPVLPDLSPNPQSLGFGYDVPACKAYKTAADGGTKAVRYVPSGSGSARNAMGASDTAGAPRDPSVDFANTDEAPTVTQLANADEGDPSTTADNDTLHTIPVAQAAAAITVRLPDGCELWNPDASVDPKHTGGRQLSRIKLEHAFAGDSKSYDQWYELFGSSNIRSTSGDPAADQACRAAKFQRVARKDSSGTTFILKKYLQQVSQNGGSGTNWSEPGLANTAWPNDSAGSVLGPVLRPTTNGNGPALQLLASLSSTGGIGYGDLATARSQGYGWKYGTDPTTGAPTNAVADDQKLWVRVQQISTDAYLSPAKFDYETADSSKKGARCNNVQYRNVPSDTTQSWYDVDAIPTTVDYPLCQLTYAMRWESPHTAINMPIDRARTSLDRIGYEVDAPYLGSVGKGQNKLGSFDYQRLPPAILSIAQAPFAQATGTGAVNAGNLQY
jgi:ABC-type phosphate transport system substrate-binding protein